jgi:hypothetical protein
VFVQVKRHARRAGIPERGPGCCHRVGRKLRRHRAFRGALLHENPLGKGKSS